MVIIISTMLNSLLKKIFVIFSAIFIVFSSSCTNKHSNEKLLRLGYMPNVTHATALVGIEKKFFQNKLGDVLLESRHFVVGNNIIDAFVTNQIDIAYIGPGPFITAISKAIPIKLLDFACNGGTVIVGKDIGKGSKIAVPQYGNTQDLLLRMYLDEKKLLNGVSIIAIPPQDVATTFFTMSIDSACLPEPWGTIVLDKPKDDLKINLLVDEKSIFNNGNYPTTILVVNSEYAKNNKEIIENFLLAHKESNNFILKNPDEAINIIQKSIIEIAKKEISIDIVEKSFKRCNFNAYIDLNILKKMSTYGIKANYYREGVLDKLASSCYGD